eukprot:TRINITY_DN9867_c0_g1_i1.p1 TRINITY_DN9867_c0_g1~~TRINITY_DN9867_c0_g1_i1.p1  ORF type:complete len:157 (-),score=21.13 TRINITY_DN9867_c0_g1_i1:15-485(-)
MQTLLSLAFIISLCLLYTYATDWQARGLNPNVEWHSYTEALSLASQNGKPLCVLFTKPWCGACKSLKNSLKDFHEFVEASKDFNMVNIEEETEEPPSSGNDFLPDGGYIPRLFFVSTDGAVHHEIYNKNGNPTYKYFYQSPTQIVDAMTQAKSLLH